MVLDDSFEAQERSNQLLLNFLNAELEAVISSVRNAILISTGYVVCQGTAQSSLTSLKRFGPSLSAEQWRAMSDRVHDLERILAA